MNKKNRAILKKALSDPRFERIILFGSQATGAAVEGSDYDILVVLKKTISIQEKMRLSAKLRRELAQKGIDADILIKSEEEIDYYKDLIGNVTGSALAEGIAL
jgi:predicted nucleotidyltransferase